MKILYNDIRKDPLALTMAFSKGVPSSFYKDMLDDYYQQMGYSNRRSHMEDIFDVAAHYYDDNVKTPYINVLTTLINILSASKFADISAIDNLASKIFTSSITLLDSCSPKMNTYASWSASKMLPKTEEALKTYMDFIPYSSKAYSYVSMFDCVLEHFINIDRENTIKDLLTGLSKFHLVDFVKRLSGLNINLTKEEVNLLLDFKLDLDDIINNNKDLSSYEELGQKYPGLKIKQPFFSRFGFASRLGKMEKACLLHRKEGVGEFDAEAYIDERAKTILKVTDLSKPDLTGLSDMLARYAPISGCLLLKDVEDISTYVLDSCVRMKALNVVNILIKEFGANPTGNDRVSPIMSSILVDDTAIFKVLLAAGADLNKKVGANSPLETLVMSGKEKFVRCIPFMIDVSHVEKDKLRSISQLSKRDRTYNALSGILTCPQ